MVLWANSYCILITEALILLQVWPEISITWLHVCRFRVCSAVMWWETLLQNLWLLPPEGEPLGWIFKKYWAGNTSEEGQENIIKINISSVLFNLLNDCLCPDQLLLLVCVISSTKRLCARLSLLSFFFFFDLRVQAKSDGQDIKSHCVAS